MVKGRSGSLPRESGKNFKPITGPTVIFGTKDSREDAHSNSQDAESTDEKQAAHNPTAAYAHLNMAVIPMTKKKRNYWVAKVKTDSTHPEKGLFTKSAATIARSLASKKVSPKGPASGMRMLTYFINRAGSGLSAARRAELEKAKKLLSMKIPRRKKSAAKKAA